MPPRGQTKKAAEQKTTPQAGKRQSKPTPKQKQLAEEEDLDDEDYEEPTPKSQAKKKMPAKAKKPASEEEEEDEELDEDELDEDEEELDEEEEEDEEDEEDEDEEEKPSQPKKTLFIKNLPAHTTEDDIKSLNSDILKVRMDMSQNNSNTKYALVDFADPETASKALEQLKGKKINGADVVMDFIGGRSMITYTKPELSPMHDPLKLYVTGFGQKITREQLVSMFPSASDITFELNPKDNKPLGFAFIHYTDPTEAKKVHDSMQDYMYEGRSLVIMYGKKATEGDDLKRKAGAQAKGSPKTKKAKKDEDDEEDDEEEDEEEDDDEENGEGEDEEDDEEGEEDE